MFDKKAEVLRKLDLAVYISEIFLHLHGGGTNAKSSGFLNFAVSKGDGDFCFDFFWRWI